MPDSQCAVSPPDSPLGGCVCECPGYIDGPDDAAVSSGDPGVGRAAQFWKIRLSGARSDSREPGSSLAEVTVCVCVLPNLYLKKTLFV